MNTQCAWCNEPADAACIDLHGRSNPALPNGYGPLCDPCTKVNDYLWQPFHNQVAA